MELTKTEIENNYQGNHMSTTVRCNYTFRRDVSTKVFTSFLFSSQSLQIYAVHTFDIVVFCFFTFPIFFSVFLFSFIFAYFSAYRFLFVYMLLFFTLF